MAKVHHRKLTMAELGSTHEELWRVLGAFGASGGLRALLAKILTRSEKLMFGRRLLIARMQLQGKSFQEIKKKLRVGESTIADVFEWLEELEERDRQKLLSC